ncbi:UNVERIFIED_CONTAM: hypothetical protein RMT77_009856 [Armadillidium vulgare]
MLIKIQYGVLCSILVFGFISSFSDENPTIKWNALIFSQQWPITSCIDHLIKNPDGFCNLFLNMTSWTVHGLWPTDAGKIGPNFCNYSWHFNENEIKSIEPSLLKFWPNIFGERSMTSLWKHEWEKHGTCAAEIKTLDSEFNYFSKGLELVVIYDYVSVLAISKIFPSDDNPYLFEDIYSALKNFLKKVPIVDCTYNPHLQRHELSQIKVCFDRSLRLIDCDELEAFQNDLELLKNHGNCPKDKVFYPSSVKMRNVTYKYSNKLAIRHTSTWVEQNVPSWLSKLLQAFKGLSLINIY